MSSLSNEQKQLLFDYAVGLTTEQESAEAELLISSSREAAEIHSRIKSVLSPLDSIKLEPCPDAIVESTIKRLGNSADSSRLRLQRLLDKEQAQPVTVRNQFWWNFGKMVAAAAVIFFFLGTLFAPLDFARQRSRCSNQMAGIFRGLESYIADHDGQQPAVAAATGTPWWKVGHQGKDNYSNTRNVWLLVKGNYVDPRVFVCPGKSCRGELEFDGCGMQEGNDFPDRRYITYSVRIKCPDKPCIMGNKPIMADSNPIFDGLCADSSSGLKIRIDDKLLSVNSANHKGKGQNVLFGDGSVRFIKGRFIGDDDIFTLQQMGPGFEVVGSELPSCESDNFLAP